MNRTSAVLAVACALAMGACREALPEHTVIPRPALVELSASETFEVDGDTRIAFQEGDTIAEWVGHFLAGLIGNSIDTRPSVAPVNGPPSDGIYLTTEGEASMGAEGYELVINPSHVSLRAADPAGLYYGAQTIRQLLPPLVEYTAAFAQPLQLPVGRVHDRPRFAWRGAMLDVARHFLTVEEVERFIDLMALYKLNRLHMHLSDDQGWRIEIPGWPNLTEHGGSTEVGGGAGGFYTIDEYAELVRYAQDRSITIVPEIDVPGHTNAALASYPELNCDGAATSLYTGTRVGFSALCPERDETFEFLNDVIGEISRRTPGPYFHIGGDEVETLTPEEYVAFVERVQGIVTSFGKRTVGWDEIAAANLSDGSIVQLWRPLWTDAGLLELDSARAASAAELKDNVTRAISAGATFVLSPADRIYLDMKYDGSTVLGLGWAGSPDTREAYDWKIEDLFGELPEEAIAGVEAPLWSETLGTLHDFEYMAFPRLPGVAELGWSPAGRDWDEYRLRLGAHAARWTAMGVNFQRSPLVPWMDRP